MPGPRSFAFVALHATGPDARVDRVFRLAARIPDGRSARSVEMLANPRIAGAPAAEAVSARLHRLYGISGRDLDGHATAAELFPTFREELSNRTIITFDRDELLRWWRACERDSTLEFHADRDPSDSLTFDMQAPCIVGITDLARLFLPGRRSADRDSLLQLLFGASEIPRRELLPLEMEQLLGCVCQAILSKSDAELSLATSALAHVISQLRATDPAAASVFEASLDLLDRPSAWGTRDAELFPAAAELVDGILSKRAGSAGDAIVAFESATPRMTADIDDALAREPFPDATNEPVSLTTRDYQIIDEIFEEHLPREMAAIAKNSDPRRFYRKYQHELAKQIARGLSRNEIKLIDAPTGTGKTMAYLIPAMLWAKAAGARVGISTYTIALQEQVFDREYPRALLLLRKAGALKINMDNTPELKDSQLRACVLKGRERYLCIRALEAAAPAEVDPPESWIAWTILALFALDDPSGDLDRVSRKLPFFFERKGKGEETIQLLIKDARCRLNCCERRADLRRCGAWAARRRAERSNIVVTNHAFVLRDPLFLRTMILDECDHIHSQARGAGSIEISFRTLRGDLEDFVAGSGRNTTVQRGGARSGRGLILHIEKLLLQKNIFEASAAAAGCTAARQAAKSATSALDALVQIAPVFSEYTHSNSIHSPQAAQQLFVAFASAHPSGILMKEARVQLVNALAQLSGICEELAVSLEAAAIPESNRTRGRVTRAANDFAETAAQLQEWLPIVDNEYKFESTCFYDLEVESYGRGSRDLNITAKRTILLPNRWLADRYYPSMQSVMLLSASTWLGGGFDLSKSYLGLNVIEEGAPEREPREVATHRSPPTFDYSRVLLAIPDDVPQASFGDAAGRVDYDQYLQRFLHYLIERTRGRTLVLLTNLQQCKSLGRALESEFRDRCIPFFYQGMDGRVKEELPRLFRSSEGGVLMGVDTFWYGVDFPGELLEYLVITKLPFAAPDRYTRAQEAALGKTEYLQSIYLPEALSMFRQGFGRLMRRETDRGSVFLLDPRVLSRWRRFVKELPGTGAETPESERLLQFTGSTELCVREALAHCGRLEECKRLGLNLEFKIRET
ncbi:MAG: ATP-dependent DNA helicase [Planctomycetota bacterium]